MEKILIWMALTGFVLYGWINNIILLIGCDWVITAEAVMRTIGVFISPIGIVLGYVNFFN